MYMYRVCAATLTVTTVTAATTRTANLRLTGSNSLATYWFAAPVFVGALGSAGAQQSGQPMSNWFRLFMF